MKALGVGAIAAACLLALAGCGPSLGALDRMARSGEIDSGAPVVAHVEMEIAAPPAKVWALLIDAGRWPQWDEDIARVSVTGPLALGTRFTWGEGSNTVHSEVQLFEPERRLAWTGTAFTAKAVHVWRLRPSAGGGTVVTVDESMDGLLMARLFSSEKLAESDRDWLGYLKKAAER